MQAKVCAVALVLAACGGSSSKSIDAAGTGGDSPRSSDAAHDSAMPDAPALPQPVYAHTNTTLFQIDPGTGAATSIGAFDCIGGSAQDTAMTDLAVDHGGTLWGISAHNIYQLSIQGTTVHCASTIALPAQSTTFYGLSFAPAGTLDPNADVLVAADTAGALWAVNAQGQVTEHGTFGTVPTDDGHGHTYANAGKAWELSGDIVMIANHGTPVGYATVRDCPNPPSAVGCDVVDTLVALDMTAFAQPGTQTITASVRGETVKSAGCTGAAASYGSLFGIALAGGSVIGFSHMGAVVQLSETDGSACIVGTASGNLWSGGGTSTAAN